MRLVDRAFDATVDAVVLIGVAAISLAETARNRKLGRRDVTMAPGWIPGATGRVPLTPRGAAASSKRRTGQAADNTTGRAPSLSPPVRSCPPPRLRCSDCPRTFADANRFQEHWLRAHGGAS